MYGIESGNSEEIGERKFCRVQVYALTVIAMNSICELRDG